MKTQKSSPVLLVIFLHLFYLNSISAHQCERIPNSFFKYLGKQHVVLRAKVIGHETRPDYSLHVPTSFTMLQIIEQYNGKLKRDTIIFENGDRSDDKASISGRRIGEEIIVKGIKTDYKGVAWVISWSEGDTSKNMDYAKTLENYEVLKYGVCDLWLLKIKEGMVIGNITRNRRNQVYRRSNFRRIFSKKWAFNYSLHTQLAPQRFSLKKFKRIMKRKTN